MFLSCELGLEAQSKLWFSTFGRLPSSTVFPSASLCCFTIYSSWYISSQALGTFISLLTLFSVKSTQKETLRGRRAAQRCSRVDCSQIELRRHFYCAEHGCKPASDWYTVFTKIPTARALVCDTTLFVWCCFFFFDFFQQDVLVTTLNVTPWTWVCVGFSNLASC